MAGLHGGGGVNVGSRSGENLLGPLVGESHGAELLAGTLGTEYSIRDLTLDTSFWIKRDLWISGTENCLGFLGTGAQESVSTIDFLAR